MMRPTHLTSTSRALYRVFIAPNLTPSSTILTNRASIHPQRTPLLPHPTIRPKSYKKPPQRHLLSDDFTFDAAINAPTIHLIDGSGIYHESVPLSTALTSFNRITHHLLQLTPGGVDEYDNPDPSHPPTCKVISKIDLRAQHHKKLEIERRKAKGLGAGPAAKNLELNWAIAGGDLKHRLEKLRAFLREGRKVEVLLGPKKRGRKATGEECRAILRAVREVVGECRGAGEAKEAEGVLGGVMTLVFEGRKLEEKEGNEEVEEGVKGEVV